MGLDDIVDRIASMLKPWVDLAVKYWWVPVLAMIAMMLFKGCGVF